MTGARAATSAAQESVVSALNAYLRVTSRRIANTAGMTISQMCIRDRPEDAAGKRVFLRFGAVDYDCAVWVNGQSLSLIHI